ncbi:MAG: hypothetical protein JNL04_21230 [Rhodospirillaceae bacterium]|nr:hypothetical protein [Rhodospirillaceae bacterium]
MAPLVRLLLIFVAVSVGAPIAGFMIAPDGGPADFVDLVDDDPPAPVIRPIAVKVSLPGLEPEIGWWWNPDEPGRGFIIDRSGAQLVVGALAYEPDGRASWSLASGALACGNEFKESLQAYVGGQTLNGRFRKPTSQREIGRIGIRFLSPSQATLVLPNGRAVPLERYRLDGGVRSDFEPEPGWWWNPAEPGRGFAVEARGGALLLTGVMYDERGNPVWYVSHGQIDADRSYRGRWLRLAGGMTMDGGYRVAAGSTDVGAVSVDFVNERVATLILPEGKALPISRLDLAAAPALALPVASPAPIRTCDDPVKLASVSG